MDALHCVEDTFCQIVEDKKGHFLVGVKENRKKLKAKIIEILDLAEKNDILVASTEEKGHGRHEIRTVELIGMTSKQAGYSHVQSAMRVTRTRKHIRKGEVHKKEQEHSYYVATFARDHFSAEKVLASVRGHWSIENRLHHAKDVSMNEDQYRAKGGFARIMTAIRSSVTLLIKSFGVTLPIGQRRFASKPSLMSKFAKCKSLEKFKLHFLG